MHSHCDSPSLAIEWRPVIALLGPAQSLKTKWALLASGHYGWSAGQPLAFREWRPASTAFHFLSCHLFPDDCSHSDRIGKSCPSRREVCSDCVSLSGRYGESGPSTSAMSSPSSVPLDCSCLLCPVSHRSNGIEHGKTKVLHSPALNKRVDCKGVMSLRGILVSGKSLPQSHFEVSLALSSARSNCWLSSLLRQSVLSDYSQWPVSRVLRNRDNCQLSFTVMSTVHCLFLSSIYLIDISLWQF